MRKIYSKVEPNLLLHVVNRKDDIEKQRKDLVPPDRFLQLATMQLDRGKTFKPHKHLWHTNTMHDDQKVAHESWCVIQGRVLAILYDIDDTILEEVILDAGDCSITCSQAGHNYECLEDNTLIYEFKSGPYFGVEIDKVFLGG